MQRAFTYYMQGESLRVRMPMELDQHVAEPMCKEVDKLIEGYEIRRLIFDFRDTEFMDSSGIGVIIGRTRTMQYVDGTVGAVNMSGQIRKVFHAAGLERLVEVYKEDENEEE